MKRLKALVLVLAGVGVVPLGTVSCLGSDTDGMSGGGGFAAGGGFSGAGGVCRNYPSTKAGAALWEELRPSGSVPQVRYAVSAVYDRVRDTLLVFGGSDRVSFYNDVRLLANASGATGAPGWTSAQVSGTPPSPRSSAIAAYNSAQDTLFIFGGVDASNQIQADLWQLTNAFGTGGTPTWSSVSISGAAPAPVRVQMSGIYSEANDTLVFFGGVNCSPSSCTEYSDTYTIRSLTGAPAWATISTTGGAPPPRYLHSAVHDSANDAMIIFGGNATTNPSGDAAANLDDVWMLSNATGNGAAWRELIPGAGPRPGASMGHSAVYDQDNHRMIVYGGVDTSNTVTGATWILGGVGSASPQWFEYDTGSPVPQSRTLQVAAYTGDAQNRMLIFGGSLGSRTYANDTWVLHNANGLATAPVTRIAIASGTTTVCSSYWLELTATAYDANDNEISGVVFVWSSSDELIATVDGEGRVTGIAEGTVTITVTDQAGTVSASVSITVTRSTSSGAVGGAGGGGGAGGTSNCTCYCGWPADTVCQSHADCPPDESVPGTYVPGVCGCPVGC